MSAIVIQPDPSITGEYQLLRLETQQFDFPFDPNVSSDVDKYLTKEGSTLRSYFALRLSHDPSFVVSSTSAQLLVYFNSYSYVQTVRPVIDISGSTVQNLDWLQYGYFYVQPMTYVYTGTVETLTTENLSYYTSNFLYYPSTLLFPAEGVVGRYYIDVSASSIYTWTGSAYEIANLKGVTMAAPIIVTQPDQPHKSTENPPAVSTSSLPASMSNGTIIFRQQANIPEIITINAQTSVIAAEQPIDTVSTSTSNSFKWQVQGRSGSDYEAVELLAAHDGTTASSVEVSNTITSGNLFDLSVKVSSGKIQLLSTTAVEDISYTIKRIATNG